MEVLKNIQEFQIVLQIIGLLLITILILMVLYRVVEKKDALALINNQNFNCVIGISVSCSVIGLCLKYLLSEVIIL